MRGEEDMRMGWENRKEIKHVIIFNYNKAKNYI